MPFLTEVTLLPPTVQEVPVGAGCPGASVGAAKAPSEWPVAELACGMFVDSCGGLSVSRPRIPSICGASEVGTSGANALLYPVFPDDRRYFEIGVAKAD